MRLLVLIGAGLLAVGSVRAASSVSPWVPIFKGIDQATGTNDMSARGTLSVNALRIDLQDPNVELMVTPPNTNNYAVDQRETFLQTPGEFLVEHGLQVAINSGHFTPGGYSNPSGTPAFVQGAVISEGRMVSAQTRTNDSMSAMFFATNKQPTFYFVNWPAAATGGVFNAVAGMYPLVSNGVNFAYFYTNALNDTVHQNQPRTAFGLSEDNRYLIMITLDGRQEFSDGAYDYETAEFLLLFGAWNGMNMDGGGSTCMVKADEFGAAEDINENSFQFAVGRPGSQRPVGCNFGVRSAVPISEIKDLAIEPGTTTAILTWRTEEPATTQVEYGLTKALGNSTPLDSRFVKMHIATLTGLIPGSNYYFSVTSDTGTAQHRRSGLFRTIIPTSNRTLIFDVTQSWKYSSDNLDGINWMSPSYDDANWGGPGPGLLHIEDRATVSPKNTLLPPGFVTPIPRTFYFRTRFDLNQNPAGGSLMFSNYVDDGAVFYLNGREVHRLRMPPPPNVIANATLASAAPCAGAAASGDANTYCPDVFTLSGDVMTHLVAGENLLAAEVHNFTAGSPDVAFGTALLFGLNSTPPPRLNIAVDADVATLYWNGSGFTLQHVGDLSLNGSNVVNWADMPGGMTNSPVVISNTGSTFYRLRN